MCKRYITDFTLRKFRLTGMEELRSPHFLEYMEKVGQIRKEFNVREETVYYGEGQRDTEEDRESLS